MLQVTFSKLNNNELYALGLRTKELLTPVNSQELGIKNWVQKFNTSLNDYKESIEKSPTSAQSVSLKDSVRDDNFVGFKNHFKNLAAHPDDEISNSAKKIVKLIKHVGWVANESSYKVETAQMEQLFAECDNGLAQIINTLGGEIWYNPLKTSQIDFEKSLRSFTSQKAEDRLIVSPTEMRPVMIEALRNLFMFLPMKYEMSQNSELLNLINQLQVELDRF